MNWLSGIEHQTLGIIELGFLGCGFETLGFIFFYRLLKYYKLNIVKNYPFVNLFYSIKYI